MVHNVEAPLWDANLEIPWSNNGISHIPVDMLNTLGPPIMMHYGYEVTNPPKGNTPRIADLSQA